MPKRKTHDEFIEEIELKWPGKYKIIGKYEKNKKRVLIEHLSCKTQFLAMPNYLTSLENWEPCPECNKQKKHDRYALSLGEAKQKIYERWENEVEIIGEYSCATEKMKVKFSSCGHVYDTRIYELLKTKMCPTCNGRYLFSQEEFELKVQDAWPNKYTILGKYLGSQKYIEVKYNECGCVGTTKAEYILRGLDCLKHCRIKTHKEYMEGITDRYGKEFEVLSEYIIGSDIIKIRHTICGRESSVNAQNFYNNGSCPACKKSTGESKIHLFLNNEKIKNKPEKSFPDCVDKIKLRFDFAILDKLKNTIGIIEFHGSQHYAPHDFSGKLSEEENYANFLEIKRRDKIKEDYCIKKNIPMLIIPYWKIYAVDKLIFEFLNTINYVKEDKLDGMGISSVSDIA